MKYLLIHLSGDMDSSLLKSLERVLLDRETSPHTIIINFKGVSNFSENCHHRFQEIFNNPSPYLKIGFSGMIDDIKGNLPWIGNLNVRWFSDLEGARNFYEKSMANDSKKESPYPRVSEYFRKGENFYVYCPACSVKLRIRSIGNHACPACSTKFYFKPDLKTEGEDMQTQYEMLSLD